MDMNMKIEAFVPKFASALKKPAQQKPEEASKPDARRDSFVPSEKTRQAMGNAEDEKARLEEMMKNSKERAEAESKGFAELAKCMKIAARIMNGDIVPMKDHKFLAEKYPDIYERAVLMRRINPEPKEYKSLIGDEDEETPEEDGETTDTSELPPEIAAMGEGEAVSVDVSC